MRPTKSGAGMTAKALPSIEGKIRVVNKNAVTEKKPTGKRAARRKSFCAEVQDR